MNGIARKKIWRLLVVAIAVGAVISLNLFTAAPAKPVAVASTHLPMAAGAHDPDIGTKAGIQNPFGPVKSADEEAYAERAFPKKSIPASAYPNGTYEFNLINDSGLAYNWGERGPTQTPNANFFNYANTPNVPRTTVSGRATAFAVVASSCTASSGNCQIQYLGTASGGVYKSTNGGQTWAPLFDHMLREAIGGITIDPVNSNIVYVGEGEGNNSADGDHGVGIYRSTDGGVTWTLLPGADPTDGIANVFFNVGVTRIIVDPRTAGSTNATLYVGTDAATIGCATTYDTCTFAGLPPQGFYYSTNGGQTWAQSNPTDVSANFPFNSDGVSDLIIDPSNPNVLYASFYGLGVYRTTNDGAATGSGSGVGNWVRLTGQPAINSFYRVTTALAPSTAFSNPQLMYVSYDIEPGQTFYRASIDPTTGAAAFTQETNTPDACDGQCWYDMPLAVDPTNSQIVYAGGSANYGLFFGTDTNCYTLYPYDAPDGGCNASIMKSTDGGATWRDIDLDSNGVAVHPDDHFIFIDPADPSTMYTTDDGGLFRANGANALNGAGTAGQVTTWTSENNSIGSLQFQGIGVGPTENVIGGTQDNGTFLTHNGSTSSLHVLLGDGGQGVADPFNPNRYYSEQYGGTMYRLDSPTCDFETGPYNEGYPDCGQTWIAPWANDYFDFGGGSFYQPQTTAVYNPNGTQASNNIFHGTYRVWRSEDYGGVDINHDGDATNDPAEQLANPSYWVPISPDLGAGTASNGTNAPVSSGNIVFMTVAPYDPNTMVVGTSNGRLYITHNALAPVLTDQGTNYCPPLTYDRNVGSNVDSCYYISGVTWTEIDAGMPFRVPTEAAFIGRSNTEFAVTLSGFDANTSGQNGHVFLTYNSGTTWKEIDGGPTQSTTLPDLPFNSIQYNAVTGHLYAAADLGVFMSTNLGVSWFRIDKNLPNTPVYQLRLDPENTTLYAATHGRGIWQVHAP